MAYCGSHISEATYLQLISATDWHNRFTFLLKFIFIYVDLFALDIYWKSKLQM